MKEKENKMNTFDETYNKIIINFYKNCIEEQNYKFENNVKSKKDKYFTLRKWTLNSFENL